MHICKIWKYITVCFFSLKIWHYSGTLLHEKLWNQGEELYDVCWTPAPGVFEDPEITSKKIEGIQASQPQASKQAYRPPGARGRPGVNFNLHSNEIIQPDKSKLCMPLNFVMVYNVWFILAISKATMKQKKKREARKAKKNETNSEGHSDNDGEGDVKPKPGIIVNLTGDPEKDKKIKNLKKVFIFNLLSNLFIVVEEN